MTVKSDRRTFHHETFLKAFEYLSRGSYGTREALVADALHVANMAYPPPPPPPVIHNVDDSVCFVETARKLLGRETYLLVWAQVNAEKAKP